MRYPIKMVDLAATILNGQPSGNAAAVTPDLNGYIKGIYVNAPDLTGTSYTLTITGPKTGMTLFSKATLTKNAKTNILADANNYPLQIPVTAGCTITVTSTTNEGADRAFGISFLIDRGE